MLKKLEERKLVSREHASIEPARLKIVDDNSKLVSQRLDLCFAWIG